jgi:hypothetical protein
MIVAAYYSILAEMHMKNAGKVAGEEVKYVIGRIGSFFCFDLAPVSAGAFLFCRSRRPGGFSSYSAIL